MAVFASPDKSNRGERFTESFIDTVTDLLVVRLGVSLFRSECSSARDDTKTCRLEFWVLETLKSSARDPDKDSPRKGDVARALDFSPLKGDVTVAR